MTVPSIKDRFLTRCLVATASGGVYSMAYPPVDLGLLVFVSLAGLLWALQGLSGTQVRAIGFLHGMTAYGISLSWLYHLFGPLSVVLWMVLTIFTVLFAEMQSRAAKYGLSGWGLAIFTALNWSAWEFIRAEIFPLKFPWMTAGLALGPHPLLPWIGVYGVSLFVIFVIALSVRGHWRYGFAGCAALILTGYLPIRSDADPASPIKVGGLQYESVTLTEYLAGMRDLPDGLDIVVWPEYALPYDVQKNPRDWKMIEELCRERDITLVFGTKSESSEGGWRNTSLTVDPSGLRGEHTKVHTVHLFDDGDAGKEAGVIQTAHGKIGTPICFDCDFEGVVRRMTANGAEFIISPVMDAMSWSARQHDQHAKLFQIRACENRRWVFALGTSGVSQIIDPYGRVRTRLDAMEQGAITGALYRESKLTFYTRHGWLTPWIFLTIAFIGWIALLIPKLPRTTSGPTEKNASNPS